MRPCLDHLTCVLRDYDAERASVTAQPGVAADRFAREIVGILKAFPSALAAAECQPVRPLNKRQCQFNGSITVTEIKLHTGLIVPERVITNFNAFAHQDVTST